MEFLGRTTHFAFIFGLVRSLAFVGKELLNIKPDGVIVRLYGESIRAKRHLSACFRSLCI
jgi:hypothetical protein